ncbi:MAG: recombinase family protein [Blastocatellia bacterium]|nr:recombinase family protein [Blastocatellia bacterium]
MRVGYARVSTPDQNLDLQRDALRQAGCDKVFQYLASGAQADRPGLNQAMEFVRPGDVLVVWKLDRLGRSLKHLIEVINRLQAGEVGFHSLQEAIDTTTTGGRLVFHLFGALAEFERELIRERTQAGLKAARARGRKGGRPPTMTPKKKAMAERLLADPETSVSEVCRTLNISRSTLYRHRAKVPDQPS